MSVNTTMPQIDAWRDWLIAAGHSPLTIKHRVGQLTRFFNDHPGQDPWQITTEQITDYMAAQDWRPASRSSFRDGIRSFYRWMVDTNRMGHSPAAALPPVRVPPRVARPVPEVVLQTALVDAEPRVRMMIRLAAYYGLRRAEVAKVHVRDLRDDLGGRSLLVHGKGGRERIVPLADEDADAIAAASGWLFPTTQGGRDHLTPSYVGDIVSAALPGAWSMHTLRHRFGTRAYASTGDIMAVKDLLGHASVAVTQRYVAVPTDTLRAAVQAAA